MDTITRNQTSTRRGLTLVEILVVSGICLLLVGIAIPSISALARARSRAVTMHRLEQLGTAVTLLIDAEASLGRRSDSSDFVADPLRFLMREPREAGDRPYLDLVARECGRSELSAGKRYETFTVEGGLRGSRSTTYDRVVGSGPGRATHPVDDFGDRPFLWKVVNGCTDGRSHPRLVEIRSTAGTPEDPTDDLIYLYSTEGLRVAGIAHPDTGGDWRLASGEDLPLYLDDEDSDILADYGDDFFGEGDDCGDDGGDADDALGDRGDAAGGDGGHGNANSNGNGNGNANGNLPGNGNGRASQQVTANPIKPVVSAAERRAQEARELAALNWRNAMAARNAAAEGPARELLAQRAEASQAKRAAAGKGPNGNGNSGNGNNGNGNNGNGGNGNGGNGNNNGNGNNGHGNNDDGVDSSNPGNSKEGEDSDPTVDDEGKANGGSKGKK